MSGREMLRAAAGLPWRTLAGLGLRHLGHPPVAFVVERQDWSIRWDGIQVCERVNTHAPGLSGIVERPERVTGAVAHFGSQFLWEAWHRHISRTNRVVVSYFHGKPEDGPDMARHVDAFRANIDAIDRVVVANRAVEDRLLGWGVPRARLVRIPIGVDTARFAPPTDDERAAARRRFGIPDGRIAIGSFQKDGVGWGDGMEPKLIKGPDLFVDAVARLARDFPVFVLLTGPARGYVAKGLAAHSIPYAHHYLKDYFEIVDAYRALDLYLMTSREEGGPKSILECAATGVPLVSSRVGMAPDVIADGRTGFLVDVGDTDATVAAAARLLSDPDLRASQCTAAREAVLGYDWSHVGDAHYEQVYRPLLDGADR